MQLKRVFLLLLAVALNCAAVASAKDLLVVKNLTPQAGISTQIAAALSDVVKDSLAPHYDVQSLEDLAAIVGIKEEQLKAGCDDTKCIVDVAGALNADLVVAGSVSKLGDTYRFSLRLIRARGEKAGVVNRASEECRCTEDQLIDAAKRVALKLIGKTPSPPVAAAPQATLAPALPAASSSPSGGRFTNSIGQEFAYIKPGTFMMGSPANEPGRDDDERQHQVSLTRGYYMQTTEVTVGQWRAFAQSSGYRSEAETGGGAYTWTGREWKQQSGVYWDNPGFSQSDNHPVTCVSWNDTQRFIQWLNQREGTNKYRLPTEAEWEYAARAGTTGPFAFGNCLSTSDANYDGNYPLEGCSKGQYRAKTVSVGSLRPNAWGLYDMHGNVWEWVQDWKGDYPTGSVTDPTGPSSGSPRVGRGGGWGNSAGGCRSANRYNGSPGGRSFNLGFRLSSRSSE